MGDSILGLGLGNAGGQLQRVKFAAHPPAERGIDRTLLRDARLAPKAFRHDPRGIMIAVARQIGDLDANIARVQQQLAGTAPT